MNPVQIVRTRKGLVNLRYLQLLIRFKDYIIKVPSFIVFCFVLSMFVPLSCMLRIMSTIVMFIAGCECSAFISTSQTMTRLSNGE